MAKVTKVRVTKELWILIHGTTTGPIPACCYFSKEEAAAQAGVDASNGLIVSIRKSKLECWE